MFDAKTLYNKKFSAQDINIEVLNSAEWTANIAYDQEVNRVWQHKVEEALATQATIWDGMYYRVTNVADIQTTEPILMKLGTVPYRYIATANDLQDLYKENGFEPTFHLSTAAMMRTAEGLYFFGKRSVNGKIDLIGGGAQPDELKVEAGIDLERSVLKEIAEETGIQKQHIESLGGLGILQSTTSNIILIFLVQLNLSEPEVREVFKSRSEDEMADLIFIADEDIKDFLKALPTFRPLIAELLN
jgi:8-oxo-dGTP pyrophosphatase MutT (NUDIX family)